LAISLETERERVNKKYITIATLVYLYGTPTHQVMTHTPH